MMSWSLRWRQLPVNQEEHYLCRALMDALARHSGWTPNMPVVIGAEIKPFLAGLRVFASEETAKDIDELTAAIDKYGCVELIVRTLCI